MSETTSQPEIGSNGLMQLPVLPLREHVLFPGVTTPIGAGRPATLRALEAALRRPDKLVFAVAQRSKSEEVTGEGLYTIGTVARIGQVQRGLSGMQLMVHGEHRGIAVRIVALPTFGVVAVYRPGTILKEW